jgi:hypothetical protein
MTALAWVYVGALAAGIVTRLAEDDPANTRWNRASTWFGLTSAAAAIALVVSVLA